MMKDLLSIYDLDLQTINALFQRAQILKQIHREGTYKPTLAGKTLGLIFEKSSTRTRLSFEVGMAQLGGTAIFINTKETQMARGETVADTARIMSCYLDAVVIRTFSQKYIEDFATYASIPVINGLTDLLHPCQILSDIFTILEIKGKYEGIKIAYVGDGNNIANSWINLAIKLPINLALACPANYEPNAILLKRGSQEAQRKIIFTQDPFVAVRDADVVYTDVWASMGQEDEQAKRKKDFAGYQVNRDMMAVAKTDAIFMHCLPAHRGEEVSEDVIDGAQSVVFRQAENRLHLQKAILEMLILGGKGE
ncbi:MAG: ornithine carbamoyltransferase [Deltaproteobacteria bacterium]